MAYNVQSVTDALLHESSLRKLDMSNLKLQKLLYYSQAWHLVLAGEPLFEEEIEAWVHGPAIPEVFRRFRHLRWGTIQEPHASPGDIRLSGYLTALLDRYGSYSAKQLESLTHNEKPWLDARVGLAVDQPSHNVISKHAIHTYFSELMRASG